MEELDEALMLIWHQLEELMFDVENIDNEETREAVMARLEDAQISIEDAKTSLRG